MTTKMILSYHPPVFSTEQAAYFMLLEEILYKPLMVVKWTSS